MGMYTKFSVVIPIKRETPKEIQEVLVDLVENAGYKLDNGGPPKLNHKFFESDYFSAQCDSYYFTGTHNSAVKYSHEFEEEHRLVLHIDCDFKNYEDNINLFLDFVAPYIDIEDMWQPIFLGYSLYEEDLNPTLYYVNDKHEILKFTPKNL